MSPHTRLHFANCPHRAALVGGGETDGDIREIKNEMCNGIAGYWCALSLRRSLPFRRPPPQVAPVLALFFRLANFLAKAGPPKLGRGPRLDSPPPSAPERPLRLPVSDATDPWRLKVRFLPCVGPWPSPSGMSAVVLFARSNTSSLKRLGKTLRRENFTLGRAFTSAHNDAPPMLQFWSMLQSPVT